MKGNDYTAALGSRPDPTANHRR